MIAIRHVRISSRRSGFVLVMVLVLLVVAGLSVAGFARKSLELARTVADAQEDLQRRWGTRSCQRFLLRNSELLLDTGHAGEFPGTDTNWPRPSILDIELDLGGLHFEIRLSDEDAKIDLNLLARRGNDPQNLLSNVVQQVAGTSGLTTLIQWPPSEIRAKHQASFQTWEQVFDLSSENSADDIVQRLQTATTELSCWGSGKLNLRRATDSTVRIFCEGEVGENSIARLLALRREGGFRNLDALMSRLDLKNKDEAVLKRLMTTESKRYGLWLTARSLRRSWVSFTIDRSGKGNPSTFESFHW